MDWQNSSFRKAGIMVCAATAVAGDIWLGFNVVGDQILHALPEGSGAEGLDYGGRVMILGVLGMAALGAIKNRHTPG